MLRKLLLICSVVSLVSLQGCVGLIFAGGAATGVTVAKDRRTVDSLVDDQSIEMKLQKEYSNRTDISRISHVSFFSVNGVVLMVGQTPHQKYSSDLKATAERIEGVRKVYNEIKIGEPTGYDVRTNDTWITSKVRTMLVAEKNFDSSHIKVVTENSQVYLMGMVTKEEGELAVEIARNVSGVTKVIRAFEYVTK